MRTKIVAGNWKMNTDMSEGISLAQEVDRLVKENNISNVKVIIAPPMTHIYEVGKNINTGRINLAAQNCSSEIKGAFTGEVSASMLKAIGCSACIIGHSERRAYYKEDNAFLSLKVRMLLQFNITPIYCCGETLKEREDGKLFEIVKSQIEEGIFNLTSDEFSKVVIAYEPVWAIGTGVTASPEQAQEMHKFIRTLIEEKYGNEIAEKTTILYGGSCNASNAKILFSQKDIDGGLIGGASLKAEDFFKIISSF